MTLYTPHTTHFAPTSADRTASLASLGDYIALLKPRVMTLVVFTAVVGFALAPSQPHWLLSCVAILCIGVGAGAAGCINMWYDRDIDKIMSRTRSRPIPKGRVEPGDALFFGILLSLFSVMLMGLALNWVAAALLAFANAFYVFIYTMWLKRRTVQNIVIGGAAGAFPPMIGWAAASGEVSLGPIVLFLLIFFWTPPHFWALALYRCEDYAKAGIPMLPVVAGKKACKRQILIYTLILLPLAVLPAILGLAGIIYAVGSLALGLVFVGHAIVVQKDGEAKAARSMFAFSIAYLFALFALMLLDMSPGLAGMLPTSMQITLPATL